MTKRRDARLILPAIYGAALLYFVLKSVWYAVCIGGSPDEIAHLGYVAEMTRNPSLIPDFAAMPLYALQSESGGIMILKAGEGTVNYLGHPPLYYLLMSLLGGIRFLPDGTAEAAVLRLRAANAVLSSFAVCMAFSLGRRRLAQRPPFVHALYAFAVATLPELAFVGAGVSNDNLAFPAFVLFFAGLLRYDEGKADLRAYLQIGIGFLLGSFSKLTAAMIMLLILAVVLVMSVVRDRSLKLVANRRFLATLPCYLLFLAYELAIRKRYGGWQPSLSLIAPEFYRTTNFFVPADQRVPMGIGEFLRHFAGGIGHTWSSAYGDREVTDLMHNGAWGLVYWVPVAAAGITAAAGLARRKADRYSLPVFLAFLGTLAWHFGTAWTGFLQNGYAGGAQARYYLFLIVPFALSMCEGIPPSFLAGKRKTAASAAALVLIACWLAGDAPKMLFTLGITPGI